MPRGGKDLGLLTGNALPLLCQHKWDAKPAWFPGDTVRASLSEAARRGEAAPLLLELERDVELLEAVLVTLLSEPLDESGLLLLQMT